MSSNQNFSFAIQFMSEYGRAYLGSGGPTSRLEEALVKIGSKFGYQTEIFATPTGVFVCLNDNNGSSHTSIARIKDSNMDLGKLCWLESIYEGILSQKLDFEAALKVLGSKRVQKSAYSLKQASIAACIAGAALSYPRYQQFWPAIASGFIAWATWWVSGPGFKKQIQSSIFRDFIGCVLTLTLASICNIFSPAPFEAFTIGGLIVLVPGLALTTAIAELADQNLVSGTAKLMQAVLTLLALGLAYLIFQDMSEALHLKAGVLGPSPKQNIILSAVGVMVSVTCFGVLFKVPRKSLIWSSLTGLTGWALLQFFSNGPFLTTATYFGSLAVGLISSYLGKQFRVPSQVFSVPGIIAMLPGMMALSSFKSFVVGEASSGLELGFSVAVSAGSIVFGLFSARIPFALLSKKIIKSGS